MADTGFSVNGVDIINMFELLDISTPGEDTGYFSNNHAKDLSNIFKKYTSGPYASNTGYNFKNVSGNVVDISSQFNKKSHLTITPDVTPTMINGDYLYKLTSVNISYSVIFNDVSNVQYLVVAGGGGGGGRSMGSGGGAGGVLYGTLTSPSSKSYTMRVGSGGLGMTNSELIGNGGDSVISEGSSLITAVGGGGGSGQNYSFEYYQKQDPDAARQASQGGSGAGATRWESGPGQGIIGQGYNGGSYLSDAESWGDSGGSYWSTGGGGGAGGVGGGGTTTHAGNGGLGVSNNITGSNVFYGGGGGGQLIIYGSTYTKSNGGSGIGGSGGVYKGSAILRPTSGANETGSGGGGGGGGGSWTTDDDVKGGDGGNGIIILRVSI